MNQAASKPVLPKEKAPGLTIGAKLIITFLGFIALLAGLLVFTYQKYVPPLVNDQIAQRTYAITQSFASAVLDPVVTRNYLRVNKIAEVTVKLPDVAYVAVINAKGIAIAGLFGDMEKFSKDFSSLVKEKGFPKDLAGQNRLAKGQTESRKELMVGGQKVFEIAVPLGESGAEAHIGIFTESVDKALRTTLYPLLILLLVMGVVGAAAIALIAQTVSKPIRQLTEQAHAISMGKLNQTIDIKCGGEVWELARSFSRMQSSIKYALEQLRLKNQAPAPRPAAAPAKPAQPAQPKS
jgi:methyl-accepting chemotaxis protein